MALKLKITAKELGELSEGIRQFYEEKNGEYILSVDGVEDTSGLKTALNKERENNKELAKMARGWEALGKTPEEIKALVESMEEKKRHELEKAGEYEKLIAQVNEKHNKTLEEKQKEIELMSRTLESHLIDANAIAAISEAGGNSKLLLPHVKDRVRVVKNESGQYEVNVLSKDKSTPLVNSEGKPINIKDFVSQMRDDEVFSMAFKASSGTGSGTPAPSRSVGSPSFKISREDAKDGAKYKAVREAAVKAGQMVEITD